MKTSGLESEVDLIDQLIAADRATPEQIALVQLYVHIDFKHGILIF